MQDVDVQSERNEDADVKKVAEEMVEVMEIAKIIIDEVSTAGGELNASNEKPVSVAPTNIITAQPSEATKTTIDITTAPKAKGIVFHGKEDSTTRTASSKSQVKDKGKAKIEAEWNAGMKDHIDWNEVVEQVQSRQSDAVRKYQALKRKPLLVAQARKNMMIYLKNIDGYKMDFFKRISYKEIRTLFEEEYNKVQTLFKEGPEMDVERNKAPRKRTRKEKVEKDQTAKKQKVPDDEDDVFVNVTPLSSKPPTIVDYKIYKEGKKEHFQIIRANGNHQMYLTFSTMLKNFDREDLEVLWKIVKDRFKESQPKKVLDIFLWHTLKVLFEHTVEDNVWKHQKGPQGLARVKNWKLFALFGVYCVTLDTIQLFLLTERMYPLTNYTLQQMFNEVRL
uniref:Uncharacterized protein n=1 Tax=Tanacetum cinerariifolium TaxID=118510 RepID=A0A6L2L1F7_TANCI|nr:hypothetical protein [Tanacetum cinerariifolium]